MKKCKKEAYVTHIHIPSTHCLPLLRFQPFFDKSYQQKVENVAEEGSVCLLKIRENWLYDFLKQIVLDARTQVHNAFQRIKNKRQGS
jgi:hypothetical protein